MKYKKKVQMSMKNTFVVMFLPFYLIFFFSKTENLVQLFMYFFFTKKTLLSLLFSKTSYLYVICERIVWCVMCDVPDFNFVRSWLFVSMGELKWSIYCCFARSPMELRENDKHRFCRRITTLFRPVHLRAVGKLM